MKHKLLVAEDVASERIALCNILRNQLRDSAVIYEAADGREALALYHREHPGIAILNIEMPGLTGLEVAQHIRRQDKTCAIFFVSDYDSFSYAQQAISLRALDYILKPYDEAKLIHVLREAMQYRRQLDTIIQDHSQPTAATGQQEEEAVEGTRLSLVREDISAFIAAHYMEELSMKNAAHAMNYSDAYFCKLFKQCFHVNFSTYLNEFRIKKARELMENSRANVKDIGTACGYTDANYFSRVFKRITGLTPTEYRLTIIEKNLNI